MGKWKTMAAIVAAAAMLTMGAVAPAAGAEPGEGTAFAVGYDRLVSGGVDASVHGVTVQVDRNLLEYLTLAGGASYVRGGGDQLGGSVKANRTCFGAGPGVRIRMGDDGNTEVFAHALMGYLRQAVGVHIPGARGQGTEQEFSMRIGGGLDYKTGDTLRLRVGIDYDGEAPLVAGIAFAL